MLPILVNEQDVEITIIKKANRLISLKFLDFQLSDMIGFHGGAASPVLFQRAYKTSDTTCFIPYNCFHRTDKQQNTTNPPLDAFYSKLRCCNLLKAEYIDFVDLLQSGMTAKRC